MRKIVILLFFILLIVAGYLFLKGRTVSSISNPLRQQSPQSTPSSTSHSIQSFGTPSRLQIPSLGIDTTVESVGMDSAGNMDVPKNPDNVAWYSLGHRIGSNGSAVIAGHFDKPDGSEAVFYRISSLEPGEKVVVLDTNNVTRTYEVIQSASYPYNNFPLEQVFNSTDMPRLNLITCEGTWDKAKKNIFTTPRGVYKNGGLVAFGEPPLHRDIRPDLIGVRH